MPVQMTQRMQFMRVQMARACDRRLGYLNFAPIYFGKSRINQSKSSNQTLLLPTSWILQ